MERGGWGQDRHVRLFRSTLRYRLQRVHEGLDHNGPVVDLAGRLDHNSYRDLIHQLNKVTKYSAWGAADLYAKGKRAGVSHLVLRPAWRFFRCYVLQGAWLEGRRGLVLSGAHAWSAFAKYAALWDLQRRTEAEVRIAQRASTTRRMGPPLPVPVVEDSPSGAAHIQRATSEL
jgi:hypothetical protein